MSFKSDKVQVTDYDVTVQFSNQELHSQIKQNVWPMQKIHGRRQPPTARWWRWCWPHASTRAPPLCPSTYAAGPPLLPCSAWGPSVPSHRTSCRLSCNSWSLSLGLQGQYGRLLDVAAKLTFSCPEHPPKAPPPYSHTFCLYAPIYHRVERVPFIKSTDHYSFCFVLKQITLPKKRLERISKDHEELGSKAKEFGAEVGFSSMPPTGRHGLKTEWRMGGGLEYSGKLCIPGPQSVPSIGGASASKKWAAPHKDWQGHVWKTPYSTQVMRQTLN